MASAPSRKPHHATEDICGRGPALRFPEQDWRTRPCCSGGRACRPRHITKRPTDHGHELGSLRPSAFARLLSEFRKVSYCSGKIRRCLSPSPSIAVLYFALLDEPPHFTASPFHPGPAVFGWPIVVSHSSLPFFFTVQKLALQRMKRRLTRSPTFSSFRENEASLPR